jgi:hypothetical protein
MAGVVLKDRRKALLLLASSLHDYTAGPSTWSKNPLSSRTERGKDAPTTKEPCSLCDGKGVVFDKFKREETCGECSGRGWDWIDAYTRKRVSTADAPAPAQTRRVMCDRCAGFGVWKGDRCELCDGAGKVSVPIVRDVGKADPDKSSDGLGPWDRAIDRRGKAGSYHELDVALDGLPRLRRRLFHLVYVAKSAGLLSETEHREVERAVHQLLDAMPAEIRVPRDVVAAGKRKQLAPRGYDVSQGQRDQRDAVWKARYKAGETTAAIALSDGVDRSTVDRGIRRAA